MPPMLGILASLSSLSFVDCFPLSVFVPNFGLLIVIVVRLWGHAKEARQDAVDAGDSFHLWISRLYFFLGCRLSFLCWAPFSSSFPGADRVFTGYFFFFRSSFVLFVVVVVVVVVVVFCRVFHKTGLETGFVSFLRALLGFTGFHSVIPRFTGFYWVLLGRT